MIKHFCDKCEAETEEKDLTHVKVSSEQVERNNYSYNPTGYLDHFRISLCKYCTVAMGLPVGKYNTVLTETPAEILNRLIQETVADEIQSQLAKRQA